MDAVKPRPLGKITRDGVTAHELARYNGVVKVWRNPGEQVGPESEFATWPDDDSNGPA